MNNLLVLLPQTTATNTHIYRIREESSSERPPPSSVHLRTDDVT